VAPAGATIWLRGGVYPQGATITRGGSATAGFTTFQAYPGEAAVIDGTGLVPPAGTTGLVTLANVSWVRVVGLELRNYTSASLDAIPAGIYLTGSGDHLEIRQCHIHDISTSAATLNGPGGAFGLAVYGTSAPAALSQVVVDGNELDHLHTGSSESLSLNGNVTQWSVTNNLVHDTDNIGIDAIGFEGTAPQAAYDQARDGLIAGNTVARVSSYGNPAYGNAYGADGIYVDGGARIVVERNRISQCDIGLELASEHQGQVTSQVIARSNLLALNRLAGLSLGGYAADKGGTTACQVINNTFFQNDQLNSGSGELTLQYHASQNTFDNNLVVANPQALFCSDAIVSAVPPLTADHNLYWSTAPLASWSWLWNNTAYTAAAYPSGSGNDLHSLFADPLVKDPATPDLHLLPGSPALGAGLDLGPVEGTLDLDGNPRILGSGLDLGAYEQ
jgi:hypothetical protein